MARGVRCYWGREEVVLCIVIYLASSRWLLSGNASSDSTGGTIPGAKLSPRGNHECAPMKPSPRSKRGSRPSPPPQVPSRPLWPLLPSPPDPGTWVPCHCRFCGYFPVFYVNRTHGRDSWFLDLSLAKHCGCEPTRTAVCGPRPARSRAVFLRCLRGGTELRSAEPLTCGRASGCFPLGAPQTAL